MDIGRSTARALVGSANLGLRGFSRLLSRRPIDPPRNVLVHRVGRLGDGAAAWPALAAVRERFADARLVLLTSTGETNSAGIVELGRDLVDEVVRYRPSEVRGSWRSFARSLRRFEIDLWQALPQVHTSPATELRNVLFARYAGARRLVGFRADSLHWLARGLDRRLAPATPEALRLLALTGSSAPRQRFTPSTSDEGPAPGFLALAPGSARPSTRWPLERFRAVAQAELGRGGRVIVLGGEDTRELGAELVRELPGASSFAGAPLAESLDLLGRARALVTNDSGLAHLGALLDCPTVVVSSARNVEGRWRPTAERVRVLRERPDCGPCWTDVCPLDHRCLGDIEVPRVLEALDQLGNGSPQLAVDKRSSPA